MNITTPKPAAQAGPPPRGRRPGPGGNRLGKIRNWPGLRWVTNQLFGYDFFISYQWASGGRYATSLAQRLGEARYDVFLDRSEYASGDNWEEVGAVALANTKRLILVATREAVTESKPVEREVRLFADKRGQTIPIFFEDDFGDLDWAGNSILSRMPPDTTLHIPEPAANLEQGPSNEAVERLEKAHNITRRRTLRQRAVGIAMLALSALAAYSWIQWGIAENAREHAIAQQVIADTQRKVAEDERDKANNRLARYFVTEAESVQEKDPDLGALLGVEALRLSSLPSVENGVRKVPSTGVSLSGHQGRVNAVVFVPGNRLASAGSDGSVRVWDANAPDNAPQILRTHTRTIVALAVNGTGQGPVRLASAGEDRTIRVWKLPEPIAQPLTLRGHSGAVRSLAFDPRNPLRLASAGVGNSVRVWNLQAPKASPLVLRSESRSIGFIAFDPLATGAGRLVGIEEDSTLRALSHAPIRPPGAGTAARCASGPRPGLEVTRCRKSGSRDHRVSRN